MCAFEGIHVDSFFHFSNGRLWQTRTALVEKLKGPAQAINSICDTFAAIKQAFAETNQFVSLFSDFVEGHK